MVLVKAKREIIVFFLGTAMTACFSLALIAVGIAVNRLAYDRPR
jgi:hypothetical protein